MPSLGADFTFGSISYIWRCAKCGVEEIRTWQIARGDHAVIASLPEGWKRLDGWTIICSKHAVVILVDGEVWPCPS